MASEWYYTVQGVKYGPVSSRELADLARGGRLSPETYVWREGMAEWQPAGRVKGLFPTAPTLPPPQASVGQASATPTAPDFFGTFVDVAKRAGAKVAAAAQEQLAAHPPTSPVADGDAPLPGPDRRRSRRPAASRTTLVMGAIAAGTLLVSCLVCGVVGLVGMSQQVTDPKQAVVGTWEHERGGGTWEFRADGDAIETATATSKQSEYAYTVVDGEKIRLISKQSLYDRTDDKVKTDAAKFGVDLTGPLVMQSQFRFDGRDRLVILLGYKDDWPTRVGEAMRSDEVRLAGKGGGVIVKLRRKKS